MYDRKADPRYVVACNPHGRHIVGGPMPERVAGLELVRSLTLYQAKKIVKSGVYHDARVCRLVEVKA